MNMFRFILVLVFCVQPYIWALERTVVTKTINGSITSHSVYYHDGELSLTLLKDGVNSFLNAACSASEQEYIHAMQAIIDCAYLNGTDVPNLFKSIQSSLRDRIAAIEVAQTRTVNPWYLALGVGAVAAACVAYAYYSEYSALSSLKNNDFDNAFKQYQKDGIPVRWYTYGYGDYSEIGIKVNPFEVDWSRHSWVTNKATFLRDVLSQLNTLYQAKRQASGHASFFVFCSFLSACLGGYSFYNAIWHHPWDEKYLEKYKELLIITEQMISSLGV